MKIVKKSIVQKLWTKKTMNFKEAKKLVASVSYTLSKKIQPITRYPLGSIIQTASGLNYLKISNQGFSLCQSLQTGQILHLTNKVKNQIITVKAKQLLKDGKPL